MIASSCDGGMSGRSCAVAGLPAAANRGWSWQGAHGWQQAAWRRELKKAAAIACLPGLPCGQGGTALRALEVGPEVLPGRHRACPCAGALLAERRLGQRSGGPATTVSCIRWPLLRQPHPARRAVNSSATCHSASRGSVLQGRRGAQERGRKRGGAREGAQGVVHSLGACPAPKGHNCCVLLPAAQETAAKDGAKPRWRRCRRHRRRHSGVRSLAVCGRSCLSPSR